MPPRDRRGSQPPGAADAQPLRQPSLFESLQRAERANVARQQAEAEVEAAAEAKARKLSRFAPKQGCALPPHSYVSAHGRAFVARQASYGTLRRWQGRAVGCNLPRGFGWQVTDEGKSAQTGKQWDHIAVAWVVPVPCNKTFADFFPPDASMLG
eukprot:gene378-4557_t